MLGSLGFGLILRLSWPRCLSAFGLNGPSCSTASASAWFYGHRALAACQPSAYLTLNARQPRLWPDSTAIVASLPVSLWPKRPELLGSRSFGKTHGPRALAACQPLAYTTLAYRQPQLRPTPRLSGPHCLSLLGLQGPSRSAASAWAILLGHRGLAATHTSAYSALPARQPRLRLTPRPSCPRCLSAFGLYIPSYTASSVSA